MKNKVLLALVVSITDGWDGGHGGGMTIIVVSIIVFDRIVVIVDVKVVGLLLLLMELTIEWIQDGSCCRSN